MSSDQIENYKKSYESMWAEIARARLGRDHAVALVDGARDLIIALEHDMGDGHETKVSMRTMDAFKRLKSSLAQ